MTTKTSYQATKIFATQLTLTSLVFFNKTSRIQIPPPIITIKLLKQEKKKEHVTKLKTTQTS